MDDRTIEQIVEDLQVVDSKVQGTGEDHAESVTATVAAAVTAAAEPLSQRPRSPVEVQGRLKRILETFTRRQNTTTTTIQEQPQGEITVDSLESSSVVTFSQPKDALDGETSLVEAALMNKGKPFPGTINAKFVKEQSNQQNIHGLKHALSASIERTLVAKEVGRLCKCRATHAVVWWKKEDKRQWTNRCLLHVMS